jgi:hypothetical protein|nr:MAG TPA: hypothetical protein [Bacteriophage sp.]
MENSLELENILDSDAIENLFTEEAETQDTVPEKETDKDKPTTEVEDINPEDLFTEEPESVGSEEDKNKETKEDTNSIKDDGTSPKENFYSSITKALIEEGIFPDLDDETASKVKTPEEFAETIEKTIQSRLDERQKRIDEALNADIEVSEIRKYENTLSYLDSIKDDVISDETEKGETLRKQLIYQDFVNRGYSKERAQREVEKSFNAGTDIEDAKEALESNRDYFNQKYKGMIDEAKQAEAEEIKERKKQAEDLKKSLLGDEKIFDGIQLDRSTRQRIYDTISKPVYKDPETGEYYTAIQKYEMDNRVEFMKKLGLIFTLTDGFKTLDTLVGGKVKKEVKSRLKELEHTLNNTSRTSDGNLKFASGVQEDPESFINMGYSIDV